MGDVNPPDLEGQEIEVAFKLRLTKATRLNNAWMLRGQANGVSVAVHVLDTDNYEIRTAG